MRFEMKMPDLAATESEIRIARWLIEPGEKVERGQPLLEVETDKATMEVESVVSGVLTEVRSPVDEAVAVGQVIAVLEVDAAASTGASAGPAVESRTAPPLVASATTRKTAPAAGSAVGLFARNRAAAAGVGGAAVPAAQAGEAPAPPTVAGIPLSLAERTAARRLQESKQTIPHFYLQTSVNASAIIARRNAAERVKPAWDAFFVLAVAKAMAKFDRFRCRLDGERLAPAETDAIGVAVDVEGQLYVIPIGSPAAKTVEQISDEIRQGVARLRDGDLEARRIRPALMTVTNLGVCNVENFIPIINPPEAAILGIGRVMPRPVARDDGWMGVEPRCTLTLSADHRIASGKYAGDFLGAIVRELETINS
jgi:pyruvate dehydrogenase E2 component (dihydrolipoamide acetyltransferase)